MLFAGEANTQELFRKERNKKSGAAEK